MAFRYAHSNHAMLDRVRIRVAKGICSYTRGSPNLRKQPSYLAVSVALEQ